MSRRIAHTAQLLALVLALALVPAALAAKGGGKPSNGSSSLSLLMVKDLNANNEPNYGDTVTFNVATTATDKPVVAVQCYQNGNLVYSSSAGFYPDYAYPWMTNFILGSQAWSSGDADCNATLSYWNGRKYATLSTLSFHVYA